VGLHQIPLDVQVWAVLAIPDLFRLHPNSLDCIERNHLAHAGTITGYAFNNDDRAGIWFEGQGKQRLHILSWVNLAARR